MADFNDLKSALSLRRMPKGGHNSSDAINDSFEEILHDLAELYQFVNDTIIPVFNGLGRPGTYNDIQPVAEGLDGATMLTNRRWTDIGNPYFWNTGSNRPNSVFETATKLSVDLDTVFNNINTINARIGQVDQNEDTNPATLSELENQVNYFIGIVRTLQSNTTGFLTASGIATAINDQTIDPASFHIGRNDIELNAGINPTSISGIDLTTPLTYTGGIPATYDLQDTILRLKEFVEDLTGDAFNSYSSSGLTGDSLKTHREKVGTGTVSTTNPHGLDIGDLTDTGSLLTRDVRVADFLIAVPAVALSGGYMYINSNFTINRLAGTVENGGTTGLKATVHRWRSSVVATIFSGLTIPASSPGSVTQTASLTNTDLQAGDLIFLSGIVGNGQIGRVFVFATPS